MPVWRAPSRPSDCSASDLLENVEVAAVSRGLSRRDARQRALEVLEEIGIAGWSEMLAGVLPYGLERRVEVARALATKPKFLFPWISRPPG